jgi:hypothetical protein
MIIIKWPWSAIPLAAQPPFPAPIAHLAFAFLLAQKALIGQIGGADRLLMLQMYFFAHQAGCHCVTGAHSPRSAKSQICDYPARAEQRTKGIFCISGVIRNLHELSWLNAD